MKLLLQFCSSIQKRSPSEVVPDVSEKANVDTRDMRVHHQQVRRLQLRGETRNAPKDSCSVGGARVAVGERQEKSIVTLSKELRWVRREDGDTLGVAENLVNRPRA